MSVSIRPHFGTDGIRGNAERDLTDKFVVALGKSIASAIFDDLKNKNATTDQVTVLIGRDSRSSGIRIEAALSEGLILGGCLVKFLGILPTPAIAINAQELGTYACAITASHNPAQDNGIKVFASGGIKTDDLFENNIEKYLDIYIEDLNIDYEKQFEIFDLTESALKTYCSFLMSKFNDLDLSGISIALDCANGASYEVAPSIFETFGANVLAINTQSDGVNINNKCGATDLDSLINFVKENNVDIAFAFDGDADRIMLLDENANVYDGDYILALLAKELKIDPKVVVATSMSNGSLKQYLDSIDYEFIETDVGDKNVAIAMAESNSTLGGEQSGHIIALDYSPFGDGILIALLISKILLSKKVKASEILNLFTPMVQLHEKVVVANKAKAVSSDKIEQSMEEHLELLGDNARIVIRPSGTEDIVRIMVEANKKDLAIRSMNELIDVVKESCKG